VGLSEWADCAVSRWGWPAHGQAVAPPPVDPSTVVHPVERAAISKRPPASFGMTLTGPSEGSPTKGIYVAHVEEGGPAALAGGVRRVRLFHASPGQSSPAYG
jgi:hypothetical protein